eukprot:g41565.t1
MVHEDNVTALQSKWKDLPKYMWLWEELYGDGEKENEIEEEESVREVTRKEREETEVRSPLTMKQSTPNIADKRASTRLKEAVERLRKIPGLKDSKCDSHSIESLLYRRWCHFQMPLKFQVPARAAIGRVTRPGTDFIPRLAFASSASHYE